MPVLDEIRKRYLMGGGGARGTGAAARYGAEATGRGIRNVNELLATPGRRVGTAIGEFGKGFIGADNINPVRSASAASAQPATAVVQSPSARSPSIQERARPLRIGPGRSPTGSGYDLTSSSAGRYRQEAEKTQITPLTERLASYQRGIDAYRDLGEAKAAASLGMTQQNYRQYQQNKAFDARVASLRNQGYPRGVAANLALRQIPPVQEPYTAEAQSIGISQLRRGEAQQAELQNVFQQMAAETDPAKIQQLYSRALAMQGKTQPEDKYAVAGGGEEEITYTDAEGNVIHTGAMRKLPDVLYRERTGQTVQPASAQQKPSIEQFMQAARLANPGVPDEELRAYYQQTYGELESAAK